MSKAGERIPARSLRVFDNGRVTVPSSARERYEEMAGEPVTGYQTFELLEPSDDGDVFEARVNGRGQIYIPSRFRDRYDIEDGDYVDLDLLVGGE